MKSKLNLDVIHHDLSGCAGTQEKARIEARLGPAKDVQFRASPARLFLDVFRVSASSGTLPDRKKKYSCL